MMTNNNDATPQEIIKEALAQGTDTTRSIALALSVLKYSSDNFVTGAKPAGPAKILETADRFHDYILTGLVAESQR